MCLAIPGKVLSIEGDDPAFRAGSVDFCGIRKTINLVFTPEVQPGDYVLVDVGFALTRIDEEEAERTYRYLAQTGALEEEGFAPILAPNPPAPNAAALSKPASNKAEGVQ